jgi:hypothetical protein
MADEITAARPPEGDRATIEDFTGRITRVATGLRDLAGEIGGGDEVRGERIFSRLQRDGAAVRRAAEAYGFSDCGRAVPAPR